MFLTAAELPPNLLRLHPGDAVRVKVARAVERVGYRLCAADLLPEVEAALQQPEGLALAQAFQRVVDTIVPDPRRKPVQSWVMDKTGRDVAHALARQAVKARRFGGPDRGIHVRERPADVRGFVGVRRLQLPPPEVGAVLTVKSTYVVQVGRYYPGSGGTPPYFDDEESPGLAARRSIVLVVPAYGYPPMISGDLERA